MSVMRKTKSRTYAGFLLPEMLTKSNLTVVGSTDVRATSFGRLPASQ